MSSVAQAIAQIISETPKPKLAIIFNGETPRKLGEFDAGSNGATHPNLLRMAQPVVDDLLRVNHLSATFISRALVNGESCLLAHG